MDELLKFVTDVGFPKVRQEIVMKTLGQFILENADRFRKIMRVYPNGQGSDAGENLPEGSPTLIPTKKVHANEPFKNKEFFDTNKKEYMDKMVDAVKKKKPIPPVLTTPHPDDPTHHIILDGNHRLEAHKRAGAPQIPTRQISHDDIHLGSHDYGDEKQTYHPLSSFKERDGSYDMNKPRKELNGKALKHYFVNTNDTNHFET
jgi:hypothetical protein